MMNPAMVAGGTLALAGVLVWGVSSLRVMRASKRDLRADQVELREAEAVSAIRAALSREVAAWEAHIEVSRVVAYDEDGVIYAARHYETAPGGETEASFMASRLAKRLTDPRYALPAPVLPIPRGRVTSDTLPRMRVPWSSVVGHVEGLPDEPHGRTSAQLRAIHQDHEREGVSA